MKACLLLSIFCGLCLVGSQLLAAQDWPHFGGPNRNFVASVPASADSQFRAWSIELGTGDAAPAVAGGHVFVNEASFDEAGNQALRIRAISAVNGQMIWSTTIEELSYDSQDISDDYPVRPIASLSYSQGRIVSVSYGGIVSCLDAKDGSLLWKHDLVGEYEATPLQYGFASSPWCDREKVVVACGGKQALLKAFRLVDGSVVWSSEKGEAAFGSFAELPLPDGSRHLCYVGRDEMVGVDPASGTFLWKLDLPQPGLTNAVTPIVLGPGRVLVAGQGFEGGRVYQVTKSLDGHSIEQTQRCSRFTPFYCNSLFAANASQVVSYNAGFLQGLSSDSGEILWKQRNWTDTNCGMSGDVLIAVRGDGFIATTKLTDQGLTLIGAERVVNDRVWAPPLVIGSYVLIRGRNSLVALDWTKLPAVEAMPAGTKIDAMNAMYGNRPEPIDELLKKAKSEPQSLVYAQYEGVINNRSLRLSEGEYRELTSLLADANAPLSLQIADDWAKQRPGSIIAFEQLLLLLQKLGRKPLPETLQNRFVDVRFEVAVPVGSDSAADIYLSGNSLAMGGWKPDGVKLTKSAEGQYHTTVRLPKGQLEFKVSRGTKETFEAKLGGANMSNRKVKIGQSMTIKVIVQAWKS